MTLITSTTASYVLEEGQIIDFWSCDVNAKGQIESGGGEEMVVLFEGKWYLFIGSYNVKTNERIIYENEPQYESPYEELPVFVRRDYDEKHKRFKK